MNRIIPVAIATVLCSASVLAQQSSATASGPNARTSAGPNFSSASSGGASMARADSKMMTDLAEANIAEIRTGELALQKAQSPEAKQFAQKMIDDHTAALKELQGLAQKKGVQLPQDTDLHHKALAKTLGALDGQRFDEQYLKRVGVNDHQRTIQLLQKAQKDAKDPDLKAMAQKMLPKVQEHLQMARKHVEQHAGSSDRGSTAVSGNRGADAPAQKK